MARSDWRRPAIERAEEGKKRIKLTVSYDGFKYHGWQAQDNAISVQSELSRVLSEVTNENIVVFGSGRTDAGVHALGQVCHFDTSSSISPEKYKVILNTKLEKSIRVLASIEESPYFHARFSTMAREYWYMIKRFDDMLPFDDGRYHFLCEFPSLATLNSYAESLFGTHDFTTFASARDSSESKCRDIYTSSWELFNDQYGYDVLRYRVAGNAFLYHQVRSMVGTMLDAAMRGESAERFKQRLDSKDRKEALRTAPSAGLYLARISYDDKEYLWFEEKYCGQK